MRAALDAVFYPFDTDILSLPADDKTLFFYNAQNHPFIARLKNIELQCYQPFKSYHDGLQKTGVKTLYSLPDAGSRFDYALCVTEKDKDAAAFGIAASLVRLKNGGTLICAGENNAGGKRLNKTLSNFTKGEITQLSKYKSKICILRKDNINIDALDTALSSGALQKSAQTGLWARPGLFSWDSIDRGSSLLADTISEPLRGKVADFGCGCGYLSLAILRAYPEVTALDCIDADHRALEAAEANIEDDRASFLWQDLRVSKDLAKSYDTIIMNPPFHEDRAQQVTMGQDFIATAAASLKAGGSLFMVANTHLPYERMLQNSFSTSDKIAERDGFKIIRAVR